MNRTFVIIFVGALILGTTAVAGMFLLSDKQHRAQQADRRAADLLGRGEVAQAMAIWQKMLDQNPDHVTVLNRLGIACTKGGDYEQAESYFRRAMQVDGREPQAYFNLALLRMRQQQMDQAEQILLQLMKIADWYPEANYHLGYIYEKSGRLELARQHYVRELNVNGGCAKAWRRYLALKEEAGALSAQDSTLANP